MNILPPHCKPYPPPHKNQRGCACIGQCLPAGACYVTPSPIPTCGLLSSTFSGLRSQCMMAASRSTANEVSSWRRKICSRSKSSEHMVPKRRVLCSPGSWRSPRDALIWLRVYGCEGVGVHGKRFVWRAQGRRMGMWELALLASGMCS